jgi:ElaB/YqjD/DUF883 family membrane-anchored ribosome-binding protein
MNQTNEARETNDVRETNEARETNGARDFVVGPDARLVTALRTVAERIRERPLTSIAAAIAIGFVIGGASSFRTGRLTLSVAARHLARQVLKAVL